MPYIKFQSASDMVLADDNFASIVAVSPSCNELPSGFLGEF